MDFSKAIFFLLAVIVMGLCIVFIPASSGTLSVTFLAVLGIYLGTDVASMINATNKLPKGEYKELKKHKYILSGISLAILIIVALVFWKEDLQTAMSSFLSAIMVVIGCLLGGLEGNKIATSNGEQK